MSDSCVAQTMVSRVGREQQRYGTQKERLVAGVVALSPDLLKVMLVSKSTDPSKWVLPKGGWENDEDAFSAACREAWEEAGLVCQYLHELPTIQDKRPIKPTKLRTVTPDENAPKATYHFFEVVVLKIEPNWPEMDKRNRRWATYDEARQLMAGREELLSALDLSSIQKSCPSLDQTVPSTFAS